ncbi:hypothetical protein OKA04_04895 [Luteolibacter flavescens]|uniref:Uncharacterized protein n=1 Tax=Luteolibacter flavescens TaxID=1859460 RepID=A0ABT3FKG8_9BACT|nr:hypothetical protein [Luteolibacter flavescens]MCW1884055.1 hypothetical protein [Luteolibacter flavescens]
MLPHRKRKALNQGGAKPHGEIEVRVIEGAGDDSTPAYKLEAEAEVEQLPRPRPEPAMEPEQGIRIGMGPSVRRTTAESLEFERPREAQIHRLETDEESQAPVQARAMSEMEPAAPYVPETVVKQRNLAAWTVGMGIGTVALAVLAVLAMKKDAAPQEDVPSIFVTEDSFGESKTYFLENMPALTREAEALLKKYTEAKSPEEVLPLVRDAARVTDRLKDLWKPMALISTTQPVEALLSESEDRPALVLRGVTTDFLPFEMAFIRDDGRLKIDWEASNGIGDVQLSELRKSQAIVKSTKVRVVVQPGNFYTTEFPETDYRSYQLVDAAKEEFVWAFVRRSSSAAAVLEREFNESSVLMEKSAGFSATLRISGPLSQGVHFFEITEMLHKGWVSP